MTTSVDYAQHEADLYSKLSHIQAQLVAGIHPRLKLSDAAIAEWSHLQNTAVGKQSLPISSPQPLPNGEQVAQHPKTPRVAERASPVKVNGVAHPPIVSTVPQSSTFDPILLRKSDELIRAELTLRRQRLETRLERDAQEAADNSHDARADIEGWEGAHALDVVNILETITAKGRPAQVQPEPVPAHAPAPVTTDKPGSSSSSFDENSYYSSKANSWSSALEEGELEPEPEPVQVKAKEVETESTLDKRSIAAGGEQPGRQKVAHETVAGRPSLRNMRNADPTGTTATGQVRARVDDIMRDESYSPPPARTSPQLKRKVPARLEDVAPRGPRAMQVPAQSYARRNDRPDRESESYSPPSPAVPPVIRNNLAAPVAPQPSRVSPLTGQYSANVLSDTSHAFASGNAQPSGQTQRGTQQQQSNRNQIQQRNVSGANGIKNTPKRQGKDPKGSAKSQQPQKLQKQAPAQTPPTQQNRKRKANGVVEERQNGLRNSGKRPVNTVQRSPEPYIKPEPMSPPPFVPLPQAATLPPSSHLPPAPRAPLAAPAQIGERREPPRRLVLRDDGRAEVEYVSPRHPPAVETGPMNHHPDSTRRASVQQPNGTHPVRESAIASPAFARRPPIEGQDLRRVASVQYASQISPSAHLPAVPMDDIRYVRAPSRQAPQYEDGGYQPIVRYQQPTRYGSPVQLATDYGAHSGYNRYAMPPPAKKRIIVLDDGEEWLAVPNPNPSRQSVARDPAPYPPRVQYIDDDPRQQQPYAPAPPRYLERPAPVRRQPEVIDLEDDSDFQRMPPPQMPMRRRQHDVDEQLRHALDYQNQQRSRAASIQVLPQAPQPPRHDNYRQFLGQSPYAQAPPPPPPQPSPYFERPYSAHPQFGQSQPPQPPPVFGQNVIYGRQPTYPQQPQPHQDIQMW